MTLARGLTARWVHLACFIRKRRLRLPALTQALPMALLLLLVCSTRWAAMLMVHFRVSPGF